MTSGSGGVALPVRDEPKKEAVVNALLVGGASFSISVWRGARLKTESEGESVRRVKNTVEPLYCGHLGDLGKCPV